MAVAVACFRKARPGVGGGGSTFMIDLSAG